MTHPRPTFQILSRSLVVFILLSSSFVSAQLSGPGTRGQDVAPGTIGGEKLSLTPPEEIRPDEIPSPAANSPALILYSQYDNPVSGISSQNFESANDVYDSFAADDFVVPITQQWSVTQIDVDGSYSGAGPGPAASVNVVFYSNTSANLPGSALPGCSYSNLGYANGPDFTILLPTACSLPPGTYWVSVQTNQSASTAGQWFWVNRTVQSNAGSAWRNPGNGFGLGCVTWGRKTSCNPAGPGPDHVFRLSGSAVPTAAGVEVSGRVTSRDGRGIQNARVEIADPNGGSRSATTNPFGYYRISDVEAGRSYVMGVSAKRFVFQSRVVEVSQSIEGVDFTAEP